MSNDGQTHTFKIKYYSFFIKEGSSAVCDSVNEPGRCFAKWNKTGAETQILHDFTYIRYLKLSNL